MIFNQESLTFSPFMVILDMVVPKDIMFRQINELVDFSFVLEELTTKYCLDLVSMQCLRFACSNIYYSNPSLTYHISMW